MKDNGIGVAGTVVSNASGIILMVQAIDLMSILVMLIGIISGLISIGYNAYKWYKKVTHENSDGGKNITLKEIEDGLKKFSQKEDDK